MVGGLVYLSRPLRTVSNGGMFGPAGAMVSTLQDQATFVQALFGGRLLPAAQMAELKTTVPNPEHLENGIGLGATQAWLSVCGKGAWSLGGNVVGYNSRWYSSVDGTKQVVVLGNEHHGDSGTNG